MPTEKLNELNIKIVELNSDIKYIKESLSGHISAEEEMFQRQTRLLESFFEKADTRYSGKWLERFIIRVGWSILGVIIPALLLLIWEVARHLNK